MRTKQSVWISVEKVNLGLSIYHWSSSEGDDALLCPFGEAVLLHFGAPGANTANSPQTVGVLHELCGICPSASVAVSNKNIYIYIWAIHNWSFTKSLETVLNHGQKLLLRSMLFAFGWCITFIQHPRGAWYCQMARGSRVSTWGSWPKSTWMKKPSSKQPAGFLVGSFLWYFLIWCFKSTRKK